jgi:hypothetical protein
MKNERIPPERLPRLPSIDMYAGLTCIELEEENFDLGEGVFLRKTFGHVMAPFTMAFARPAEYDQPHPGPWKSLGGGFAFDIEAELKLPPNISGSKHGQMDVARTILAVLRLGIHPAIQLPVFANHSFREIASIPDRATWLRPFDFEPRYFPLDADSQVFGAAEAEWVRDRWRTVLRLRQEDAAFALALDALDRGQFIHTTALALVSLWAALEALFSPSTSELKFRVSTFIAAYLEPPGETRLTLQKQVAKLYDKRSAAAHGRPNHASEDLLETFNLLARALRHMVDEGSVPNKDDLERALFGVERIG